jgi:receptor protein-tyrosine kinase
MNRSNVVTASIQDVVPQRAERSIGAILVQEGRLTIEDAEKVLRVQREKGLQFGTAAISLASLPRRI